MSFFAQLRRFTAAESRKLSILEINYTKMLEGMKLNYDQFVDMCILCGCDYTDSVRGVGPKKAYNGIR